MPATTYTNDQRRPAQYMLVHRIVDTDIVSPSVAMLMRCTTSTQVLVVHTTCMLRDHVATFFTAGKIC